MKMHKFTTKPQGIKLLSVRESADRAICPSSPKAVWEYMKAESLADREIIWVLHLNRRRRIIHKEMAAMGGLDRVRGLDIKMVFRGAVISGAASIITVHNHPSGNTKPSKTDRELWLQVGLAGDLLGIEVLDNLVISKDGYFSQRDEEKEGQRENRLKVKLKS